VRQRARSLGVDLAAVIGSGPDGRVLHADVDRLLAGESGTPRRIATTRDRADDTGRAESVRGVRRRIAERLSATWTEVPHITYVDAVDVTELERLRDELNRQRGDRSGRLTMLPFIARAMALACAEQPRLNAHYDHATETLTTFEAVHLGVATQTDEGLLVPVIRNVEARGLWDLAAELTRLTTAARDGSATREQLTGSTITVTSLGALGGLVTTPILNAPEVAIVGVNRMETRPVWRNGTFEPRQMFNLSSSFDHRLVDGWDAAVFVQRVKTLLEAPALLFIGDE
jgi:2-oxoisovalerate dehydrogenase E2 component (dihydrolipoyl transacylase)